MDEYRCFVGGLAWATDDHNLQSAFSNFGEILDAKIIQDRETGRSRGFGFVTFATEESMQAAIEGMNGKELDGRSITVNQAQLSAPCVSSPEPSLPLLLPRDAATGLSAGSSARPPSLLRHLSSPSLDPLLPPPLPQAPPSSSPLPSPRCRMQPPARRRGCG